MRHVEDTLQKSCVAWWDWTHPRLSHLLFQIISFDEFKPRKNFICHEYRVRGAF